MQVYKRRWLVLFVFCFLSLTNNMTNFTYSPIANLIQDYYQIDSIRCVRKQSHGKFPCKRKTRISVVSISCAEQAQHAHGGILRVRHDRAVDSDVDH